MKYSHNYLLFGILLLLAFSHDPLQAQSKYTNSYVEVGINQGLSQSTVNAIVQDSLGYLWLSTGDGLNRFDGYKMTVFRSTPEDPTSISDNWITDLHIDQNHNLWVGTEYGLNRFDYKDETFSALLPDSTSSSIIGSYINDIVSDTLGNIWIATSSGVTKFNPSDDTYQHFQHSERDSTGLPTNNIFKLTIDKDQNVWLGTTDGGLVKLEYPGYTITTYPVGSLPNGLPDPYISSISTTPTGNVLVGSFISGIYEFDTEMETFSLVQSVNNLSAANQFHYSRGFYVDGDTVYTSTKSDVQIYDYSNGQRQHVDDLDIGFLDIETVNNVFKDRSSNIWLATELSGAFMLNMNLKPFQNINHEGEPDESLNNPVVWSFHEDDDGNLWIATDNGLSMTSDKGESFTHFLPGSDFMSPDHINSSETSVVRGNEDYIWVGTISGGLNEFNRKTGKFNHYYDQNTDEQMAGFNVIAMEYDDRGFLWIGTYEGLTKYDINKGTFTPYSNDPDDPYSIPHNTVWDIRKDKQGQLWVTTRSGLATFNLESGKFTPVSLQIGEQEQRDDGNLSINSTFFDQFGNTWVGSAYGIHIIDSTGSKEHITLDDGLPNEYIYNIVQGDRPNTVWASSNFGLSRITFNPEDLTDVSIQNFDQSDGLGGNEFNAGAALRGKDGTIYFGGVFGYSFFDPEKITTNANPPNVVISKLSAIKGNDRRIYPVSVRNKISLSHEEDVLFIDFSVIDFTNPENNRYEYRLKGFNDTWIDGNGKPNVVYTNLSPGDYVFEARGANSDGIWRKQPVQLSITVVPPFYRTTTFYIFMVLFVIGSGYWGLRLRERSLRRQTERLETEVQKQTSELRQSEEIFRQISDNAGELISMLDTSGRVIYANPTHQSILGMDAEEIINSNVFEYIHPEDHDKIWSETEKLKKEGFITFSEYRLKHKNGTWRVFQTSGSHVRSDETEGDRFIMVSHDVTRQKKIQKYLIESRNEAERANQAKSSFLAGISHELRTPLNAILGFSQILRKETNLSQRQQSYVDTMLKSGNHLLSMINEVLDISKIEANRMSVNYDTFSFKSIMNELTNVFKMQCEDKGLDFNIELEPAVPAHVYTDAGKVRQIMINLIGNAVKFTNFGHVKICVETVDLTNNNLFKTKNLIEAWSENISEPPSVAGLKIVVEDTGKGIPEDHLKHIFEPFQQIIEQQNYNEGTGLGLAISSRLAKLLGGEIHVESEENQGSVFTLFLPAIRAEQPSLVYEHYQDTRYQIDGNRRPKILVVDDIEYNLTLLREILDPVGFITSGVYNGQEAIEMLKSFTPDAILMDLKMPVMDGEEAMKRIRTMEGGKDIAIIAISASGFEDTRSKLKDEGFDDFIHKPFRENELLDLLGDHLKITYQEEQLKKEKNSGNGFQKELLSMDSELRDKLTEAIELIDWSTLHEISDDLEPYPEIYDRLARAIKDEHYLSMIKVGEQIQDIMDAYPDKFE